mmetsp:Transcript_3014/g.4321  ORF Transcript_3014/g.4321 Transcript_3014/m.4321 type:complete len:214 (+) Transcript_3014:182-823(+)
MTLKNRRVSRVKALMSPVSSALCEALATSRKVACVWTLSRVNPQVLLQGPLSFECHVASRALVRSLVCVSPYVLLEMRRARQAHLAPREGAPEFTLLARSGNSRSLGGSCGGNNSSTAAIKGISERVQFRCRCATACRWPGFGCRRHLTRGGRIKGIVEFELIGATRREQIAHRRQTANVINGEIDTHCVGLQRHVGRLAVERGLRGWGERVG